MSKSYQAYLKLDDSQYEAGEYLVMIDEEVVRHGRNLKQMVEEVEQEYPDQIPFIAKVPHEGVMVLVEFSRQ
jgi:hypothetical protein